MSGSTANIRLGYWLFYLGISDVTINIIMKGEINMEDQKIRRFLFGDPSEFKIVGCLVGIPDIDLFTGESSFSIDCRLGNEEYPIDITPFLENVTVVY